MRRLFAIFVFAVMCCHAAFSHTFEVGDGTFLLDGEPFVVRAAELHYPRIPRPYWEHRIEMCKALGMNTICLYVFWNIHEQREGEYDFTGQNDVAAFCCLAQRHGMWVIVRPGPYVCAEWEMGGLPWWLLKKKDIRLREQDPYFMERVRLFEQRVGEQLSGLTVDKGGPIIMVQVENEYGSYGVDKPYVSAIRDIVRASGFDKVTLFQCDWASNFELNGLDDLLWTMNFGTGSDIDEQFARLARLRPSSPKMCSEYWSGWFDKWGARHETRPADEMVDGISQMLDRGISFSLYMTHGGTSFGHWAGANSPGYAPDVTSYDYDAPVSECGLPTAKYHLLREVMRRHSASPLPDIPSPPASFISIPTVVLDEYAPLEATVTAYHRYPTPPVMEDLDMGWGLMVYRTVLPVSDRPTLLTADEVHDYARVFVGTTPVGSIDRVKGESSLALPPHREDSVLTIVVEGMGRINFGRAIKDYKGLIGSVSISDDNAAPVPLTEWSVAAIPDDVETARAALAHPAAERLWHTTAGYYRGYFDVQRPGDTFVNMEAFGKGQVYINGHAIGRFWNIGPQMTLYVPGCWLVEGRNEIIVLDVIGPQGEPALFFSDRPVLDRLSGDNTVSRADVSRRPDMDALPVAYEGALSEESGYQRLSLSAPVSGRFLAVEALDTYDGGPQVTVAEVYAVGRDGQRLDRVKWTACYADSEETTTNSVADKAFDRQETTCWLTAPEAPLPHVMVIDMGGEQEIVAVDILLRTGRSKAHTIRRCRLAVY